MEIKLETKPTHWVAGAEHLLAVCDESREVGWLGVDLEFNSIRKKICLIQIALPSGTFLIDTLHPTLDLTPLFNVFQDEGVVKIAHSASEDIRLLVVNGCTPRGVFDTDIAWRLLNHPNPSLRNVLQENFQVELSKGQQRSNWSKRPLSDAQLRYAALDVHYLYPLFQEVCRELNPRFSEKWVFQETQHIAQKFLLQEEREAAQHVFRSRFDNKAQLDELLDGVFKPLQQGLVSRYGENAGRFLLSNAQANRIAVSGKYIGPEYRLSLYKEVAVEVGISFDEVFTVARRTQKLL